MLFSSGSHRVALEQRGYIAYQVLTLGAYVDHSSVPFCHGVFDMNVEPMPDHSMRRYARDASSRNQN